MSVKRPKKAHEEDLILLLHEKMKKKSESCSEKARDQDLSTSTRDCLRRGKVILQRTLRGGKKN